VRNSIWFMASGDRCYRFDLGGQFLEILEQLPSGNIGEHQPRANDSTCLCGLITDGLVKSNVCERYGYVAVYNANAGNFVCEDFSFV
jgi:hypothetical protein